MKVFVVLVALFAIGLSAPQPRELFHEHFEHFFDLIEDEAGHDIANLMEHYFDYEEFRASLDYLQSTDFKALVEELESLPEFIDVISFLEKDNIDILYFLNLFNEMLEISKRSFRHDHDDSDGHDFSSFIRDSIKLFPKEKLAALYEQKLAEDETFKSAMENLASDEWDQTFGALWKNEVFLAEVQKLKDNGIEVEALLEEIVAIFGQN